ncbi:hypothetical protein J1N35_028699 [Gossypium stocksii]|uniref:Cytochrome b5 heme-binding domain-containing protein n=1 Tax=Gossypium stocksii TaxID=47602 RepID=A0A9D3ZSN2_9ROSI|nr:hypothetical protein J1N35_028699 [Gossypium stocksii]
MNSHSSLQFLLFLSLSSIFLSLSSSTNDTDTLTLFRRQANTHGNLISNWTGSDACSSAWHGTVCSSNGHVISLSLPSLSLRGPIPALSLLDQFRILDLQNNRLNGTVSPLTNCSNLKLVYLSDNDFSGDISLEISRLKRLLRLDLSNNNIQGNVPKEISGLKRLITLRLQNNALTDKIPDFFSSFKSLKELNLTNNEFFERLPGSLLKKFSEKSFVGNEGLCGSNLFLVCSFIGSLSVDTPTQTVPSNPSLMPRTIIIEQERPKAHKGLNPGAIVAIVVANCVVFLVVVSFAVAYFCGRNNGENVWKSGSDGGKRSSYGSEKKVYANGGLPELDSDGTNAIDRTYPCMFFKVYNVTQFLDDHSGGVEVLLAASGKDATDNFKDVGLSDDAREQMQKYYIGEVDATTIPTRRRYKTQTSTVATHQEDPGFLFKIIQFLVPLLILGFAFGLQFLGKKEKTET